MYCKEVECHTGTVSRVTAKCVYYTALVSVFTADYMSQKYGYYEKESFESKDILCHFALSLKSRMMTCIVQQLLYVKNSSKVCAMTIVRFSLQTLCCMRFQLPACTSPHPSYKSNPCRLKRYGFWPMLCVNTR